MANPQEENVIFQRFKSEFKEGRDLCSCVKSLYSDQSYSLAALVVEKCNGADSGVPFSRATIATSLKKELYPFGSIFYAGFNMLKNYLEYDVEPTDVHSKKILGKLLTFLLSEDSTNFLLHEGRQRALDTESKVAAAFSEHVFGKLAARNDFRLDIKHRENSGVCRCACGCQSEISSAEHFGNTSIGHRDVWHGNVDIMLGSNGVAVCPLQVDNGQDCPNDPGKNCSCQMSNIEDLWTKTKMISQTIVFSFLQAKCHTDKFKHFLVPFIGLSKDELIFYFYDSVEDVLLQSGGMPLALKVVKEISYQGVVALWMVLNYTQLCSGLPDNMKATVSKANFHKHASSAMKIYQNDLTVKDVVCNMSSARFEPYRFNPNCMKRSALICEYADIKKRK